MNEVLNVAQLKVDERARARRDKFFLANEVLGYDFQECHAELFACYPQFDEQKNWAEQIKGFEDVMVLWSRGHYKSTALIVVIIQAILCNPDITILLLRGTIRVTELWLEEIAKHFLGEAQGSRLKELFPEFCGTKTELNSVAKSFTVPCRKRTQTPQATCTVASPKSIKTSQHWVLGIFDDMQNESNWRNPKIVARVHQDFMNCQPLIQHGARWVSGTRWTHGDLYDQILRWNTRGQWMLSIKDCWTDLSAAYPDAEKIPRFPGFLKKNGEADGFTREALLLLQEQDPQFFACQYLNRPVHGSKQAYTKEMLETACIAEVDTPGLSSALMVVDLASSDSEQADDSVVQVGRIDSLGTGYLCDQRGGQWVPMELALNIIDMALRNRPSKILLEKTASCVYFADYLRLVAKQKNVFLPLDFIKVNNKPDAKNVRVLGLAGHIKRGRFKFLKGLSKFGSLIEQAITFPKARHGHDDYIDTCALLQIELSREFLVFPIRQIPRNEIWALIEDRESALVKVLTNTELREVEHANMTGLD